MGDTRTRQIRWGRGWYTWLWNITLRIWIVLGSCLPHSYTPQEKAAAECDQLIEMKNLLGL